MEHMRNNTFVISLSCMRTSLLILIFDQSCTMIFSAFALIIIWVLLGVCLICSLKWKRRINVTYDFQVWRNLGKLGLLRHKRTCSDQLPRLLRGVWSEPAFLSHMNICRKHFPRFPHNLKTNYDHKHMENPYQKLCVFLFTPGFPIWRQKWE